MATPFLSSEVDDYFFRQKIALFIIFGFLLGVFASSFIFIQPLFAVLFILISIAVLIAEKIWNKKIEKAILLAVLAIISFSSGIIRYDIKDFHINDPAFESAVGTNAEIVGIAVSEPELRDNATRILIETPTERILVSTDLYTDIKYGDEIRSSGKISKPGMIDDGAGRPFDYAKYLAKDDIYFLQSFAEVEVLSSGLGNPIKSVLFKLKRSLVSRIKEILAEPHASLLAGLVVAGKDAMPKDILEEFRRSGVIHIVVLSGYNITIIAEFMRKIFESLLILTRLGARPRLAAGASIVGIIFFILMTGAEPTVVRAGIMVLVVIGAKLFGRTYSASRALLGAAFLMILHNPKILVFDPSFQLSFLATLALIYVVPIVEKYLERVTEKWGVRTMIATTISTQAVVLPYLVYSMGEVSLVSLPANILILLFIPITMLVGFIASIFAYISPLIAMPFAYIAHLLLGYILGISHVLGNLPFAVINIPTFPVGVFLVVYILIITLVLWSRSGKPWPGFRTFLYKAHRT